MFRVKFGLPGPKNVTVTWVEIVDPSRSKLILEVVPKVCRRIPFPPSTGMYDS